MLMARETVTSETPASRATSLMRALPVGGEGSSRVGEFLNAGMVRLR
jgi:hypothetical protein